MKATFFDRFLFISDGQRPDALYLALLVSGLVGPVEKSVEKTELEIFWPLLEQLS